MKKESQSNKHRFSQSANKSQVNLKKTLGVMAAPRELARMNYEATPVRNWGINE